MEDLEKELSKKEQSQSRLEAADRNKETPGLVKLILKAKLIECKSKLEAFNDEFVEILQAIEKILQATEELTKKRN